MIDLVPDKERKDIKLKISCLEYNYQELFIVFGN